MMTFDCWFIADHLTVQRIIISENGDHPIFFNMISSRQALNYISDHFY
jgi:hypothetical protein